jgi:hypothetical protein
MANLAARSLLFALVGLGFAGCLDGSSNVEGGCPASEEPLLVGYAYGNMPSPNPPPTFVYFAWNSGEVWAIEYEAEWIAGNWSDSTMKVSQDTFIELPEICSAFSAIGRFPTLGQVERPGWEYAQTKVHYEIAGVEVKMLEADELAHLEALVRDQLSQLPRDASKPGCADGGTYSFWGRIDETTFESRASCDWTSEFESFRAQAWPLLVT